MLYIIGGNRDGVSSSEVFEVDLKHRTVFPLQNMNHARRRFHAVYDKKHIYCIGGTEGSSHSLFEKFNIEEKTWVDLAPLEPGYTPTVVVADKYFILAFSAKEPQYFFKYLIMDNKWVKEESQGISKMVLDFPTVCMANYGRKIVFGKAVRDTNNVEIAQFDPLTNKLTVHLHSALPEELLPLVLTPLYQK